MTPSEIRGVLYASNGVGGDLGAQIQSCIDALAGTGGVVLVDFYGGDLLSRVIVKQGVIVYWYPGIFIPSRTIEVYEGAGLVGMAGVLNMGAGGVEPATTFKAANGLNADVIWAHDHTHTAWQGGRLQNFFVDGNKANQSSGSGIRISRPDIAGIVQCVQVQNCKQGALRFDGPISTDTVFEGLFGGGSQYGYWFTAEGSPGPNTTPSTGTFACTNCGGNLNTSLVRVETGGRLGLTFFKFRDESNIANVFDVDVTAGVSPVIAVYGGETYRTPNYISYTGAPECSPSFILENVVNTDSDGSPTNLYLDNSTPANTFLWSSAVVGGRLVRWSNGRFGVVQASSISYPSQAKSLSNGLNSNISLGSTGGLPSIRIVGPTGPFSIGGFVGETVGILDGRELTVINGTSQVMTIINQDVNSTPANRILTTTGANVVLFPRISVTKLLYSGSDARWILVSTTGKL